MECCSCSRMRSRMLGIPMGSVPEHFNALFLVDSQINSGIQCVGAASIDFGELCFVKNQLFGDETGADGEVLLGYLYNYPESNCPD